MPFLHVLVEDNEEHVRSIVVPLSSSGVIGVGISSHALLTPSVLPHPAPCALRLPPCALRPAPCAPHPAPCAQRPAPCVLPGRRTCRRWYQQSCPNAASAYPQAPKRLGTSKGVAGAAFCFARRLKLTPPRGRPRPAAEVHGPCGPLPCLLRKIASSPTEASVSSPGLETYHWFPVIC